MIEAEPKFDLSQFMFFSGRFGSADFNDVLAAEADAYMSIMRDRFIIQSQGGGEWPDLAESTQRERAYLGFQPDRPILIRLGELYDAMVPGQPGNWREFRADVVVVGIGGPFDVVHTQYRDNQPMPTIGQIAFFHQYGTGKMPQREILVGPDFTTMEAMRVDATNELARIVNQYIALSN